MRSFVKNGVHALVPGLNMLLIVTGAILTYYMCFTIFRTYGPVEVRRAKPLELTEEQLSGRTGPLPAYQEELFKKKFLFNQPVTKRPQFEGRAFVLVGVSAGEKMLAVIKDTKANKSYYCSVGEMVGDFKVKQITKEKVVLESEDGLLEIGR